MPDYKENITNIIKSNIEQPEGYRSSILDIVNDCMEEKALEYLNDYKTVLAQTVFSDIQTKQE